MTHGRGARASVRGWLHAGALGLGAAVAWGTATHEPAAATPPRTSAEAMHAATAFVPLSVRPSFVPASGEPPLVQPAIASDDPQAPFDPLGHAYRDGLVITGATPHRLILFSFDDGPDVRTTPLLLDRLAEADVRAVFFLVAERLRQVTPRDRQQAAIARDIAARGHLVGAHTVHHVPLPKLDDAAIELELDQQDLAFERLFGARPSLFRPPYGARSERIDKHLAERAYTSVLWNLGSGDFQVRSADEVFALWLRVFEHREREFGERGGIILLHDTYAWSVDAFERIHGYLMARNCELLEQGQELFDVVDDLAYFHVPRQGEPAIAEAAPAQLDPAQLAARQAVLRERTARRCHSLARSF